MGKGKGIFHSEFISSMKSKAKSGTLRGVWQDWLWIWSFSRKRWVSVVLYTLCGIFSSALGLAAGVLSKYLIDAIITLDTDRLLWCCVLTVISAALGVAFQSLTSRFSARLNVNMHNDVQAAVFDSVLRSDWMELSRFASGDLANRFSADAGTVASCAVSWLPNLIIQLFSVPVYNFYSVIVKRIMGRRYHYSAIKFIPMRNVGHSRRGRDVEHISVRARGRNARNN